MKRNGMKNLWRLLAVLPLRACPELAEGVRGSQTCPLAFAGASAQAGRTSPLAGGGSYELFHRLPTPDYPRSSFAIWALAFELYLPFASLPQSASPHGSQKQMADDETNRMYFSNLIGRPTYEREHLNLGKTGDSHKTNPSQLRRVSRPAPTARENTWQTNETNHAYVGVKRAAGNRLTYEKRVARLQKTSHSYKTNHPGFPHTLPPF